MEGRFQVAVLHLAMGIGPLQHRLTRAMNDGIQPALTLYDDDPLPEEFKARAQELEEMWERFSSDPRGKATAWAEYLSDEDASEWAKWIVEAYAALTVREALRRRSTHD